MTDLEKKLENELVKRAKRMGFTTYKLDKIPGTRDNPDQLLINPDRVCVHVEVKRSKNEEARKSQAGKHRELRRRGQHVFILDHESEINPLLELYL